MQSILSILWEALLTGHGIYLCWKPTSKNCRRVEHKKSKTEDRDSRDGKLFVFRSVNVLTYDYHMIIVLSWWSLDHHSGSSAVINRQLWTHAAEDSEKLSCSTTSVLLAVERVKRLHRRCVDDLDAWCPTIEGVQWSILVAMPVMFAARHNNLWLSFTVLQHDMSALMSFFVGGCLEWGSMTRIYTKWKSTMNWWESKRWYLENMISLEILCRKRGAPRSH